ncbi:MAG: SDR family NAD(P)-dependent oxidoreductase [Parvularculales bacterium]
MGRLADKKTIVTGASSGIGRASARLFAREGASVVAVDRTEETLYETVEMITKEGGTAIAHVADVADEDAVKKYITLCTQEFGRLDAIYANAGISGQAAPLVQQTVDDWLEILRVNLIGPFLAVKHASPIMAAAGGGSIICTASVAGIRANAGHSPYGASKAGVINLIKTSAYELYGTGVRVNAVCPGIIETGMTKPIFDRAKERGTSHKIGQLNPMARYGYPEEIATMVSFLASDEASYINGQAIPVDGGLTSSLPYVYPRRD